MSERQTEIFEATDLDVLKLEILEALPEEYRVLGIVGIKAAEQSYWVNDGRTTPQKAASLILEQLGYNELRVA